MNNYRALRKYRKIRQNRKRMENTGIGLFFTGLFIMVSVSGDHSTLSAMQTLLVGLGGCGVMGIGSLLVSFMQRINEEYPLKLILVDKGDEMCYTVSTVKTESECM